LGADGSLIDAIVFVCSRHWPGDHDEPDGGEEGGSVGERAGGHPEDKPS
jgi:hypothetical protein